MYIYIKQYATCDPEPSNLFEPANNNRFGVPPKEDQLPRLLGQLIHESMGKTLIPTRNPQYKC